MSATICSLCDKESVVELNNGTRQVHFCRDDAEQIANFLRPSQEVPQPSFQKELAALVNRHNLERHSNTPDFILAQYMASCLHLFNKTVGERENWYHPVTTTEHVKQIDG